MLLCTVAEQRRAEQSRRRLLRVSLSDDMIDRSLEVSYLVSKYISRMFLRCVMAVLEIKPGMRPHSISRLQSLDLQTSKI